MAASVSPLPNNTRTRDSNPLPKPTALAPKRFKVSTFRNGGSSRRGAGCANLKNLLPRARLLALALRSVFHPELTCDGADVSPGSKEARTGSYNHPWSRYAWRQDETKDA